MKLNAAIPNAVVYVLAFLFIIILLPLKGGDMDYWKTWSIYIEQNGVEGVYSTGVNYPPLFLYFLYVFCLFQDGVYEVAGNIHFVKIIPLIFDFIGAFFVLRLIKNRSLHLFYFCLMIFNPAYIYNTAIWGQVDGILATFVFISIFFAWGQRILLAYLFLLIALNFKLQGIIFIPLIFLLSLIRSELKFDLLQILKGAFILLSVQALIWLPFIINGELQEVWNVYATSVDYWPMVSMKAFNFWYFIFEDPYVVNDSIKILGISSKHWGYLLFFFSSAIALFPLCAGVFRKVFLKMNTSMGLETILLTGILLPLIFFYFNTQMHERYAHPALIFMVAYAFISGKYFPYIVGSVAYFLNLEQVWRYLALANYKTFIFDPVVISCLYLAVILYCLFDLYKVFGKKEREVRSQILI